MGNRIVSLAILAVCAVLAAFLMWNAYRQPPMAGTPAPAAQGAYGAPFQLVNHKGEPVTEQAFRGHPSVVFFGFTHCPEICPTTLFEMDGWLKTMGDEGKDIRAFFVTVDPERDTPKVLGDYVTAVSDRITGLTGELSKIKAMYGSFRIYARKVEDDSGGYTMDHTASVLMLDSGGGLFGTISYGENADTAIEKLKRLAKS